MRHAAISLVLAASASTAFAVPPKDRPGCADSKLLSRMPGCMIATCRVADYDAAQLPTGRKGTMAAGILTPVEGAYERVRYSCPKTVSPLQVGRNAEAALKAAGYKILYSDTHGPRYYLTAQKGPQWVNLFAGGVEYEVTAVRTKAMEQVMAATADAWADQINQTGRVSIYGINFDTGKATLRPDCEKVLAELTALLQKNPEWALLVAGHTDNTGSDQINVPLSRQRAEAVVAWLGTKGIDKARLVAAGFGSRKPLAENTSEDGKAKNRRVDLVKLY